MAENEHSRAEIAVKAGVEEIQSFVHDPSSLVLKSLLMNRNLTEEDILIIADRKNVPGEILETIARDRRWSDSYPVRLALCRNPMSPLSVSLSAAKFLRIFDLEELTRNHFVPLVFRHKVEAMIAERIPTMPLGNKKTLAKKAAGKVLLKLLQDRIPEVVKLSLDNPHMLESHLYKVISRADTTPKTVMMIAEHATWSSRPLIRFSLARNPHTPLSVSVRFLRSMKMTDLRELHNDPQLPVTIKPFVHRELVERGIDPGTVGQDRTYEIGEEEMASLEAGHDEYWCDEREEKDQEEDDDEEGPVDEKND